MFKKKSWPFQSLTGLLIFLLVFNSSAGYVQAQPTPFLPDPYTRILTLSSPYSSPVLRGMRVYPENPFEFDFMVDAQDKGTISRKETSLLIKYFLTFLTIPEGDLWVNLSPYEKGRIVPADLSVTDAGNILLEQDKLLKQLTSSLTYPETGLGRKFWAEVYKKAAEIYGTTDLPINTFNKVWIVPDKAIVYDMGNSAVVGQTHLKVMMEEDYLALKKNRSHAGINARPTHSFTSMITKRLILPELEKEVNTGKNFAPLRQMFYSLILADWYKRALRRNVLSDIYINKRKTAGVDDVPLQAKEKIYREYLRLFKKGAYNYIREDEDPVSQKIVPRKYFSGGCNFSGFKNWAMTVRVMNPEVIAPDLAQSSDYAMAHVALSPIGMDPSMTVSRSSIRSFVLTVALALLGAGGVAQAAVITHNSNGTLHVAVQQHDTLGQILLDSGYRGQLWGARGIVAQLQPSVESQIPSHNINVIQPSTSFNIPGPENAGPKVRSYMQDLSNVDHKNIGNNFQRLSRTIQDLQSTFDDDTEGSHIFGALAHPVVPRFRAEADALDGLLKDPGFVRSLPEGQRDDVVRVLGDLEQAAQDFVKTWTVRPARGALDNHDVQIQAAHTQSLYDLERNLKDIHRLLDDMNGQIRTDTGSTPVAEVSPLPAEKNTNLNLHPTPVAPAATQANIQTQERIEPVNVPLKPAQVEIEKPYQTRQAHEEIPASPPASKPVPAAAPMSHVVPSRVKTHQIPWHYGKKFYVLQKKVQASSVEDNLTAKLSGFAEILDASKTTYKEGETILIIRNLQLESRITTLRAQLHAAEEMEASLEQSQAAPVNELQKARENVQSLQQELTKALAERELGKVKAPHKLVIRDFQVDSGTPVEQGAALASYFDEDRVRFEVDLPISANNNDLDLTIDGKPVKSITGINWLPTVDPRTAHLTLVVTPSSPIRQGQTVQLSLKVYSADGGSSRLLHTIVASGSTRELVRNIETYPIDATADGPVNFLVREGDKVEAGQIVARVDPKPYLAQYQEAVDQVHAVEDRLRNEAPASGGTIAPVQIDKLQAEDIKWKSEVARLRTILNNLVIKAPRDGVIVSSWEHQSGTFKSGEKLLEYSPGTVFLGDFNDPSNAVLLDGPVHRGDYVLVTTQIGGYRLVGRVTNVVDAFSPDIQLNKKSVEIKVLDPRHVLRIGMGVNVSLLDKTNQQIAAKVWTQENSTPVFSGAAPPPPPKIHADKLSRPVLNPRAVININPPLTSFPVQGPSVNLTAIGQKVRDFKLTAVTQRISYLQNQLAEKYPNSKYIGLDFNVYSSGGKTYIGGGVDANIPDVAIDLASGNAYGAAAKLVFPYFLKIAELVTHQKAKQIEYAKIQTEIVLREYQAAVLEQTEHAKDIGIDLGTQQQIAALYDQYIKDLEMGRKAIVQSMQAGVGTQEQLMAFDNNIAEAKEARSEAVQGNDELTIQLNTLTGRQDLHAGFAMDIPWQAEFPAPSQEQENAFIEKLLTANPQIQRAQTEIAKIRQQLKLKKIEGWQANATGVYSGSAISSSFTEPAFGGGETWRASEMNPGENGAEGLSIPLYDGKKKIDQKILALELQKKTAELELMENNLRGEVAVKIGALRDLSSQIQQAREAYQNALKWWELKAGFTGTLYAPQDWATERGAMNKWAVKIIQLKGQYLQAQDDLQKLGVLGPDQSLIQDSANQAMAADRAQLAGFLQKLILAFSMAVSIGVMPLHAQQLSNPNRDFNAWKARSTLPGPNSTMNVYDSNPFNREPGIDDLLSGYQGTAKDVEKLGAAALTAPADVRERIFLFLDGSNPWRSLRFLVNFIQTAQQKGNGQAVNWAYQSIGDIFTDNPGILDALYPSSFDADGVYPNQRALAQKILLAFIAKDPDGLGQDNLLMGRYWRTDELARLYNEMDLYFADPKQAQAMKDLFMDVLVRKIVLERINEHFQPGEYQNVNTYSLFVDSNTEALGRISVLPDQLRLFLNSPGWRKHMGLLRGDLLAEARRQAQNLIDQNQVNEQERAGVSAIGALPRDPQDTLAYLSTMTVSRQGEYLKTATKSELARILPHPYVLKNADDLNLVLDRLMGDAEGRLLVMQDYINSNDELMLRAIEARQNIDTVKQDAQNLKTPAAMGVFRRALYKMGGRTQNLSFSEAYLDTYSFIELSMQNPPAAGAASRDAQIKLIATKWAVRAIQINTQMAQKDSYSAGMPVHSVRFSDALDRLAQKIESLNDPQELEKYLTQMKNSGTDKEVVEAVLKLRNDYIKSIYENDQQIVQGHWWQWAWNTGVGASLLVICVGLYYLLSPKFWDWKNRKFASLDKLMRILEDEFLNNNGKGEGVIANEVSVPALLKKWEEILQLWDSDPRYPIEKLLNDQVFMAVIADAIIVRMKYTPDLVDNKSRKGAQNEAYQKGFSYFVRLANRTSKMVSDRMNRATEGQRHASWETSERMNLKMIYVQKFLDWLQGRVNLNLRNNEHFQKGELEETFNYPTALLGFESLVKKPENKLEADLRDLMETGNFIVPGLYKENEINATITESKKRWLEVKKESKRFGSYGYAASSKNSRKRSWYSRHIFTFVDGFLALKIAFSYFGYGRLPFLTFGRFNVLEIFGLLASVAITFANYLGPTLANKRLIDNKNMKEVLLRLRERMAEAVGLTAGPHQWPVFKKNVVENVSQANNEEQIIRRAVEEAESHEGDDPVVLLVENHDPKYIEALRETVRNSQIIGWGTQDGDTFFKALRETKSGKDNHKLFLFVEGNIPPDDPRIQLGIYNLYAAAKTTPKGGLVLGYAQDAYVGPPVQHADGSGITFGTHWTNIRDLHDLSRPSRAWVISDLNEGLTTVARMYENLDLREHARKRFSPTINIIRAKGLDLDNESAQQMMGLTRLMTMSPEEVQLQTVLAEELVNAGGLRFIPDIIIPRVMAQNFEDPNILLKEYMDYIQAQIRSGADNGHGNGNGNGNGYKESFERNLNAIRNASVDERTRVYSVIGEVSLSRHNLKNMVYLPERNTVVFASASDRARHLAQRVVDAAMNASAAKRSGGIDLDFQPQFINRFSTAGLSGRREAVQMSEGFQGFNFHIVRFTPSLTVNDAFHLMFGNR
ncbi:MAG: TolC family protein [Candidatus Omnitrophica bacterium]|nr:TolC family protein [Candidatus Omnitrophota bacterium]